jgi:hypothetical protein
MYGFDSPTASFDISRGSILRLGPELRSLALKVQTGRWRRVIDDASAARMCPSAAYLMAKTVFTFSSILLIIIRLWKQCLEGLWLALLCRSAFADEAGEAFRQLGMGKARSDFAIDPTGSGGTTELISAMFPVIDLRLRLMPRGQILFSREYLRSHERGVAAQKFAC